MTKEQRMIRTAVLSLLLACTAAPLSAEVIGTMEPAPALTEERLAQLDPELQAQWREYLARSAAAMERDKAVLAAERQSLHEAGQSVPPPPPEARNAETLPLDREPAWYAGAEARAAADNVVSYQTPTGGWGKNQDRSAPPRQPGQSFIGSDAKAGPYAAEDGAGGWRFVGTLDNDATTSEIAFLARVQGHLPGAEGEPYRESLLEGVRYLLEAELPGGGWPQVYPLHGGYSDMLTFNDDVLLKATGLLQEVAAGEGDYAFVPPPVRAQAAAAVARAMAILLDTQVMVNGRRTIWAQQYDPLTREPVGARNFEPIALATGESASALAFVMRQGEPDPAMRAAIEAGASWFASHALRDVAWKQAGAEEGRRLVAEPGARPLWARFYDLDTQRPIFGDRDRSIHSDVNDISLERRNGYSWFNRSGEAVARTYERWRDRAG